jgi:selenocysteine-specific elongation factor
MGAQVPDGAAGGAATAAGEWLIDPAHAERLRCRLAARVAAAAPYGLPSGAARQALELPADLPLNAVAGAEFTVRDGRLHPAGPAPLPPRLRAALDTLRTGWRASPFRAPSRQHLAELGLTTADLALLAGRGELERYAGAVLPRGAAALALSRLRALPQPFTAGECRRALDTSRAVAIGLLEALDAAGRTVRAADGRRALRPANGADPRAPGGP